MKLMKQYSNFEITDNYPMINLDKLWIDWDKMYCMFCDDKNLDSHTTYEESHSDKKHTTHKKSNSGTNDDENKLMAYLLCYILIPAVSDSIHNYLESNGNKYSKMFQDYGNRIRTFGSTVIDRKGITNGSIKNIYAIPERINYFIKALRHPTWSKDVPVRVVIDSIKNLFEITFLRDRYSAFYLVTASKSAEARRSRLVSKKINTSTLELNERPSQARKIYKRFDSLFNLNNNENESNENVIKQYIKNKTIAPIESDPSKEEIKVKQWEEYGYTPEMMDYCYQIWKNDKIRAQCYLNDLYTFFLQDVEACIQHADIFITVSPNSVDEGQYDLKFTLAKYVMLMMHPGFILPTPIERCMQIAYTAKANSGCLSRQVGAVVTDKQFKILSLGWNDVPCGQVTCIRRNLLNLKKFYDSIAYSDYEKGEEFHKHIDKFDFSDTKQTNTVLDGLPAAYCFKDLYQGITNQRDQTYTRALHGEEKALANCNPVETAGGFLFTTSSPCEMCAKRARDYQISKVFYIEPYPGISQSHIFNSGAPETRTVYELFVGAIGLAYTKLFSPLLPYKDELQLRGFLQNRSKKKPLSEEPKLSEKAPENHRDSDISSPAPNVDSVPVPEPRADRDWSLNALPIGG